MVSYRKRYRDHVEGPDREAPPVTTSPSGHPRQSAPTETQPDIPKPAEPIEQPTNEPGPAEEAAQSAMKQRLAETERAASMQREAPEQPQLAEPEPHEQPTVEQIIEATQLPERAKRWLLAHPEYLSDISKNQTIIALHDVAKRQAGSEWTDMYFEKMEDLLGIRPAPQSNSGNGTQRPGVTPRNAPVRQQQYSGPPIAAPPHRDVPSMGTGRSQNFRTPPTQAEVEIARVSGISVAQYQENKEKMLRLKASGVMQDGQ